RRRGELALAAGLFRGHHYRRALPLADRSIPRIESCTDADGLDADGTLAGNELHRQFHRGLARQLLVRHGQVDVLSDDRRHRAACGRRHPGLVPPAEKKGQRSRFHVMSSARRTPRAFAHVATWVFDLDNTLYPHHLNLWQQVDERIRNYIAAYLKVTQEEAFRLQKDYYKRYGTSMRGLMTEHGMKS